MLKKRRYKTNILSAVHFAFQTLLKMMVRLPEGEIMDF